MFQGDPENKEIVNPPKPELVSKNQKKKENDDSLQKQLDSMKKCALSKPSDLKVTNRSFWNADDRMWQGNMKSTPKGQYFQYIKKKADQYKHLNAKDKEKYAQKAIVLREKAKVNADAFADLRQIESYYKGRVADKASIPQKYQQQNVYKYPNYMLMTVGILFVVYYVIKMKSK